MENPADKQKGWLIQKMSKPADKIHESIGNNMKIYDTTQKEAHNYETHCHNCGKDIDTGKKYCNKGCRKCVEDFNYKCHWGKSCKMCGIHEQYYIVTRNITFDEKKYWIDSEKNIYDNSGEKVAFEKDEEIIFV